MKANTLQTDFSAKTKYALQRAKIMATTAILALPMNVYASGAGAGGSTTSSGSGSGDPMPLMIKILDQVIKLFPAIGIVIALVGAFKLFMAFRNDQPDAYSGAAKDIVIGVVLFCFDVFIWPTIKTTFGG